MTVNVKTGDIQKPCITSQEFLCQATRMQTAKGRRRITDWIAELVLDKAAVTVTLIRPNGLPGSGRGQVFAIM